MNEINKTAVCSGNNAVKDFEAVAKTYGAPLLPTGKGLVFISQGWLFVCFPTV